MKVDELIEKLKEMPPDAEVYFDDNDDYNGRLWDIVLVEKDSNGDVRLVTW